MVTQHNAATHNEAAPSLSVRAPRMAEVEAIAALCNAAALVDFGVTPFTAESIRNTLQIPGMNPARDAWVAQTGDGQLVGWLNVSGPVHLGEVYLRGCVHPAFRGRGVGRVLLARAEARARRLAASAPADARISLRVQIASGAADAQRLFTRRGYQLTRHFWRMRIDFADEPPAPVWAAGLAVRTGDEVDAQAIFQATEEAFEDHYGHLPMPFAVWSHFMMGDASRYDPSLWFLAVDETQGDAIAGMSLCKPCSTEDAQLGYVDTLGVRRPWRRRGVGLALLRHSFRAYYARGLRSVALDVDAASLTGATRLYERAGMRVVRQNDQYTKELRPGRVLSVS